MIAVGALIAALGACSNDVLSNLGSASLLPRAQDLARPDWLTYTGGKEEFTLRPVGPEDLISQDGQCAISGQDAAPASTVAAAPDGPDLGAGAPRESSPAPTDDPVVFQRGGIALQMTECEVARRAGPPERLELGTSERGQRTVTFTYIRGARPGIYRFADGRLYSIERAPEAAPAAKSKAKPAKKQRS